MDRRLDRYEHLPIPTYEEATSTRPTSSQSRVGPEEISDDAERQGLLGDDDGIRIRPSNYEPPTVESERPSLNSLDGLESDHDTAEVRREMQEMDMEDPNSDNGSHRSLLTYRFKRFANFTNSFPSLSLPSFPSFRRYLPAIPWPKISREAFDANRVVIFGHLFGIFLIVGFLYLVVASDILQLGRNRLNGGNMFEPESIRQYIQAGFDDRMHIKNHLEHITRFPHMAGSEGSFVLGEWVQELFKAHRLEGVGMDKYEVYLNYPKIDGRQVLMGDWKAGLEEDAGRTPVFHGHSKAGEVSGPLVYANFGSQQDFQTLKDNGIDVKGAVVLVRYYGTQEDPGLKVQAAEEAGAVGCIIYSDPAQDGSVQGPEFPEGRYMPQNGVQRGAVSLMSRVVGDVLSPGWAATVKNKQRLQPQESRGLVLIPSIPISWTDAQHMLTALLGHGKQMERDWAGAPNTVYFTGDQSSPVVTLKNDQDEVIHQPIYNVIGHIKGWEQPQKRIIVGNHRDSWCLGAASPGSGTALMLAISRIFGELKKLGWRPLRTIEFVNWDAGQYNAAGSTEYVEEYIDELRRDGIAYLNIDAAVTGIDFHAAASPVFEGSLRRILHRVADPLTNRTIREIWEEHNVGITPLAAGGDYVPFQFMSGTSSIDLKYRGTHFPQNSCFDNYEWMNRFGDSNGNYNYASALGQVMALLILELADAPLLPLDMAAYRATLQDFTKNLQIEIDEHRKVTSGIDSLVSLDPINNALGFLDQQIQRLTVWDAQWHQSVYGSGGFETSMMTVKRIDRNNRLANFESRLLDLPDPDASGAKGDAVGNGGGLPERSQYKHAITAPGWWDSRTAESFPGIRYWMAKQDWNKVSDEIKKVADILSQAAMELSV